MHWLRMQQPGLIYVKSVEKDTLNHHICINIYVFIKVSNHLNAHLKIVRVDSLFDQI